LWKRVVENGSVVSADISYYDDLIRKEFPKDTCKTAHIMRSTSGKQKILTGGVFFFLENIRTTGVPQITGKRPALSGRPFSPVRMWQILSE
jgi:hypothetical protein